MHTPDDKGAYVGKHHTYQVYEARDTSLANWNQWNLICLGTGGKLVSFQSRREMDCLIKYINDEVESTTLQKYAIGLHSKTYNGIFEWQYLESNADDWDAPTPSFSNWKTGVEPSTANAPCVYMEVGKTTVASGLWSVIACSTNSLLAICEYEPDP